MEASKETVGNVRQQTGWNQIRKEVIDTANITVNIMSESTPNLESSSKRLKE